MHDIKIKIFDQILVLAKAKSIEMNVLRGLDDYPKEISGDVDLLMSLVDAQSLVDCIEKDANLKCIIKRRRFEYLGIVVVSSGVFLQIDFFMSVRRMHIRLIEDRDLDFQATAYGFKKLSPAQASALKEKGEAFRSLIKNQPLQMNRSTVYWMLIRSFIGMSFLRYLYWSAVGALNWKLVVFLGPDGAGKSSAIEDLASNMCDNRLFADVEIHHLRPKFLPALANLALRPSKIENKNPQNTQRTSISSIRYFILCSYYFLDFLMLHFTLFRNGFSNKLTVFDRYFYDYLIYHQFPHKHMWFPRTLCYFIPKPTVIVVMLGDPEIIWTKKRELTLTETKIQLENLKRIDSSLSVNPIIQQYQKYDGTFPTSDIVKSLTDV